MEVGEDDSDDFDDGCGWMYAHDVAHRRIVPIQVVLLSLSLYALFDFLHDSTTLGELIGLAFVGLIVALTGSAVVAHIYLYSTDPPPGYRLTRTSHETRRMDIASIMSVPVSIILSILVGLLFVAAVGDSKANRLIVSSIGFVIVLLIVFVVKAGRHRQYVVAVVPLSPPPYSEQ